MVRSSQEALTSKANCNKAIHIPLLFEIVDRTLSEMWFLSSVLVDSMKIDQVTHFKHAYIPQ